MSFWGTLFGTNTKGSNKTEPNNKNTLRDGEVAKFNEYINDLTNVEAKLNKLNSAHKFNWIQPEIDNLAQFISKTNINKDNLTKTQEEPQESNNQESNNPEGTKPETNPIVQQPITSGGTRKKRKNRKHKKHKKKTLKH
jgi:hypothetical protein